MRYKLLALTTVAAIALGLSACGDMSNANNANANTNANANARANTNANANAEMANNNANANANSNRSLTREDYERNKERYQKEAKESGRSIGTGLNDGWLWTKARFELAAANDLRDSTINVDVNNGIVTLMGTVPTAAQKAKAESIVKALDGVKGVKNELKVAPSANTNANVNTNANRKAANH